jgi:hypothetical protein
MAVTDVSDALPDVSAVPGMTYAVTFDDANAKILKLNVWALNLDTGQVEQIQPVPPLLAYEPQPSEATA